MHRELTICVTFLSLSLSLPPPPSLLSSHVCVSLKIIEKLLSECDAQRLQLITDSYLNMLHNMLESSNTDFQIMATDSVRRQTAKHRLEILLNSPPPLSLSLPPSPSLSLSPSPPLSQFVVFSEREEQTTPYHRQYDFFIHRFAAMALVKNSDSPHSFQQ